MDQQVGAPGEGSGQGQPHRHRGIRWRDQQGRVGRARGRRARGDVGALEQGERHSGGLEGHRRPGREAGLQATEVAVGRAPGLCHLGPPGVEGAHPRVAGQHTRAAADVAEHQRRADVPGPRIAASGADDRASPRAARQSRRRRRQVGRGRPAVVAGGDRCHAGRGADRRWRARRRRGARRRADRRLGAATAGGNGHTECDRGQEASCAHGVRLAARPLRPTTSSSTDVAGAAPAVVAVCTLLTQLSPPDSSPLRNR